MMNDDWYVVIWTVEWPPNSDREAKKQEEGESPEEATVCHGNITQHRFKYYYYFRNSGFYFCSLVETKRS